jgi:hypothetical protein
MDVLHHEIQLYLIRMDVLHHEIQLYLITMDVLHHEIQLYLIRMDVSKFQVSRSSISVPNICCSVSYSESDRWYTISPQILNFIILFTIFISKEVLEIKMKSTKLKTGLQTNFE